MKRRLTAFVMMLVLAGCGVAPNSEDEEDNTDRRTTAPSKGSPSPSEDGVTVTFVVTTTGKKTLITWRTSTAGTSHDEITRTDWSKKLKVERFDVTTLTVMSSDSMNSAKVTCEILVNGVSKYRYSSQGIVATATCTANTSD